MSNTQPYSYVVLRYVHDVVTGEFVNVGIVMIAPKSGKLLYRTRKTISRMKNIFPDLNTHDFREIMRSIDHGLKSVGRQTSIEGLFAGQDNASAYASRVIANDDSALQWSQDSFGISKDIDATFERIFERFVSQYDKHSEHKRSDDDVWKPVSTMLADRGVNLKLQSKVVVGNADSIEFDRAWKNGKWHVYEPISFDLADADNIKDKARRWRGHLAAVAEGVSEDVNLHFIIGTPSNPSLKKACHSAVDILRGAPFAPKIFDETSLNEFVDTIEDEVRAHKKSAP